MFPLAAVNHPIVDPFFFVQFCHKMKAVNLQFTPSDRLRIWPSTMLKGTSVQTQRKRSSPVVIITHTHTKVCSGRRLQHTPFLLARPSAPHGSRRKKEKKKKRKKKGTQATETLTQVVFWYKRGHSGPAALLVSMVTDSCFGGKRSERGRMPRRPDQVYITACNKGYGETVKHSWLAGEAA